jgi:hypothetical protein
VRPAGATLAEDVRHFAKQVVKGVEAIVKPFAQTEKPLTAPLLNTLRSRNGPSVLQNAGMVLRHCENGVALLPTSDAAAVRRRLLAVTKLVKTSLDEVVHDHGLDAATGEPTASSLRQVDDEDEDEDEDSDFDDDDDEDEDAGENAAPHDAASRERRAILRREFLRQGVLTLRGCMGLLKATVALSDAVAPILRPSPAVAAAASAGAAPAAETETSLVAAAAAPAPAPTPAVETKAAAPTVREQNASDAIAAAAQVVHDAVIDFAAAVNERDTGAEAKKATAAVRAGIARLIDTCKKGVAEAQEKAAADKVAVLLPLESALDEKATPVLNLLEDIEVLLGNYKGRFAYDCNILCFPVFNTVVSKMESRTCLLGLPNVAGKLITRAHGIQVLGDSKVVMDEEAKEPAGDEDESLMMRDI